MTPAGTSNELDVQNEWEENTNTHNIVIINTITNSVTIHTINTIINSVTIKVGLLFET